ncbi:Fungalysin/Thermolysin Propeptide Motif [Fontimonas thermophila]|uniref:Fungalysin/Thermolysin Propeptide Motif n=1 Tax=Fontimonas thermophila TaxID=1076937 RepID=A0A1I2I928_9GAMM|nr:M36 family metallopeptidase [Fontimonas thermophila]SFF37071.1 Fungalysin/Thermolysin Propeptide Motif [Fontimonas thermophila]
MNPVSVGMAALVAVGLSVAGSARASEPASQDVILPTTPGQTVVVEWTGTALPGVSGIGTTGGIVDAPIPCLDGGPDDSHLINLTVPDGAYDAVNVSAEFKIEWTAGEPDPTGTFTDPDLVLAVYRDGEMVGYSDGGAPQEAVGVNNPASGAYTAVVCPFIASMPTDYRAKLTLTALEPASCLTAASAAKAHSTTMSGFGAHEERPGLLNFDVFQHEVAQLTYPVLDYAGRHQAALYDRTLAKPTFLWARKDAPVSVVGPLTGRELLIAHARAHLHNEAKALRLTPAMIDEAKVYDAQFNGQGPAVVRFRQRVAGIEVYYRSLNVLLDRGYRPIAVSGYFATDYDPAQVSAAGFVQSPAQAIAAAWRSIGGALDPSALVETAVRGDYLLFSIPTLTGSHGFERAPRVKRVFYPRRGRLEPAYYVELFARAHANGQLIAYAFVVSASDLRILHRKNLKSDAAVTYRVFADTTAPYQPFDAPLGNGYTPFPGSQPNDPIIRVGASTNLVTIEHAGISTGDPWLADDATTTIGNNVEACLDTVDTPVSGIISNPLNTCVAALGDVFPPMTGPNTFDYPIEADSDPSTDNARNAAAVNLFYMNNWLHDWWYDHGFNEAAGNAQTNNYGRGGEEGDPILAQGQDASGRNNANMSTPADGSSPTMQQYLFDGITVGEVRQTAPVDSGPLKFAPAAFGPTEYDLTGELVLASESEGVAPGDGCGAAIPDPGLPVPPPAVPAVPDPALTGKIALIDRGNCNFTTKAQHALASGAVAMIVVNNADGDPIAMGNGDIPINAGASPTDPIYQIPSVMIRKADGAALKAQLAAGTTVTMHLVREPSIDLDGTLDNQIIAHEFFHYVHHRLTDSSNQQSGAMSEGWGDIDGFMISARSDDRAVPGNDRYQGAYALAWYVSNNFFSGIRRAPYSTDFAKNAFTFRHIADGEPTPDGGPGTSNSEVHNAGEIWANAVWECYAGLLNRHPFGEAQRRMKDYIIGGLKMTPADATYTEARDAVLSVVLATDFDDYAACSRGFAKRGMGLNAIAPARSSTDLVGVVEDYTEFVCKTGGGGANGGSLERERFGGALGLGLVLPLLGLALLARRRCGCPRR